MSHALSRNTPNHAPRPHVSAHHPIRRSDFVEASRSNAPHPDMPTKTAKTLDLSAGSLMHSLRVRCTSCRRRSSNREATLFFYYDVETCFRDHSATHTDGALHADVISTACMLMSVLHLASPRCPPLCSCLEATEELNSTSTSSPSVARPTAATAVTVRTRANAR